MRISYALNVLNGEPFIWYQIKSIYEYAHEILIVEGAYKKFAHAARGFRSVDDTINIIKRFPDPENKIKLIARDYFYDDRVGMCNEFMADLTGDVLWQVDVDEFYHNETHRYIKELFANDEQLDTVSFNFVDYYAGFDYVIEGYNNSQMDVIRINRIYPGMRWASQRPPTLELNGSKLIPRKKINGKEMLSAGHLMHNATMMFDAQVRDKFIYYSNMWPKGVTGSQDWFEASWKKFEIKFCVAGMLNSLTYLVPRISDLPEVLKEMQVDIRSRKLDGFEFSSKEIQFKIEMDKEYEKKLAVAKAINKIESSSLNSFLPRVINSLILLLSLSPSRDKKFMRHVLLKSIKNKTLSCFVNSLKSILSLTVSRQ